MHAKFGTGLWVVFGVVGVQSINFGAGLRHDFSALQQDSHQAVLQVDCPAGVHGVKPMSAAEPSLGKEIPLARRTKWRVECDSEEINYPCINAIHGSNKTFWQTRKGGTGTQSPDPLPHAITIDLGVIENVNGLRMTPFDDENNNDDEHADPDIAGVVAGHKVYLSLDNKTWSDPVAFGTWYEDTAEKFAIFEPRLAQFVRLQAISAGQNAEYISVANLSIWSTESFTPPPRQLGIWGATIDFPLVPVGVFIDPLSGKLVSFSSFAHDRFGQESSNKVTLTSTWDPTTELVSQRKIEHTKHDMFCPGTAFDVNGRMVISGGEKDSFRTSIYNPMNDTWIAAGHMKKLRGYQGSTTTSDGQIFVIGGSWAPDGTDVGGRTGEIYDPETNKWTLLKGCPADPIETTEDWEGKYRADNHVWLQGWKNNTIFHAGPAKQMNWITTNFPGAIEPAGRRAGDRDAMAGVAAMYDAAEGKILAAGGAPQYKYKDEDGTIMGSIASDHAYIITLGEVNKTVDVKAAGGGEMHFKRIFHHAVILPNGDTFVVGGQIEGQGFTDTSAQMTPEIYSPVHDTWTPLANHSTVRTYHSFALLLRDATILVGGGGLCGECTVNHFDAQVYTPPYLLTPDGELAVRPAITDTSAESVFPGDKLTIKTDSEVVSASLVRYGAATHSLNNDQRRIALKLEQFGEGFQYKTVLPADGGVAIPGYYMLFVINANGVPSHSKNVQVLIARK